jgi:hypothetical protein
MLRKHSHHLLLAQGIFYFIMGIWPIVHMPSFLKVTGNKTDLWLVVTVGVILMAMSIGFIADALTRAPSLGTKLIAFATPFVLAVIDVYYVQNGTISSVYLGDAIIEIVICVLWIFVK